MCPKYEYVNLEVEKTLTQSGISVVYFSLPSQRPYAATDDTDWRNFLIQTVFCDYVQVADEMWNTKTNTNYFSSSHEFWVLVCLA